MADEECRNVLYIGEISNERLDSITQFSTAGMNKKDGFITVFQDLGYNVEILSPIFVPKKGKDYERSFSSLYRGIVVDYPFTLRIHPVLNIVSTLICTLFELIEMKNKNFDTIIFYNFELQYCFPAIISSYLYDASLIVEYEDGLSYYPEPHLSWSARFMRWIAPLDGAFLVSSILEDDVTTENTAVVRGVASVYEPDIDAENLHPERFDDEDPQGVTILFSGGLRNGKGVDTYIDAIQELDIQPYSVQFLICGHGKAERKNEIRQRVNKLNSTTVSFLGQVEPWESYLSLVYSADILVALEDPNDPYNQHCFPSKLIEYAMTGNIVITSNISDVGEIEPQPFVIVDEYTPEAVGKNIKHVLDQFEEEKERAEFITQQWISKHCSIESTTGRVERVIQSADS